jgi:thymidine phosphorylase
VLRRNEQTRFSSASDDKVGGLQSAIRAERSEAIEHGILRCMSAPDISSQATAFNAVDIIQKKCDGFELSAGQIDWIIAAYTAAEIADEQMAALAMAVLFRGLSRQELDCWTRAMINSGERLDFSGLSRPTVDKHSTGGVGDKITLPLVPLVAACGAAVPQLSGRGLGHTGGTLDKLESIPGWRASLSNEEMLRQLEDVGAVICAPGAGLVPADRRLYALRDVTGTVESIPLIASSIMSKKIAEGASALVLDVKVGSGAFMKTQESARELAQIMVDLGRGEGVTTVALLTDMSVPLGLTAGNALEVVESVEVLAGGGPSDVIELTVALAREMVAAVGRDDHDPADLLASGAAMDVWRSMIKAQGGDPDADLPVARETDVITAERDGVLQSLDARAVGEAAWRLGAGRTRKEHAVQPGAGVVLHAKPGMRVRGGQPLITLHTDTPEQFGRAHEALATAYEIGDSAPKEQPLILDRVT